MHHSVKEKRFADLNGQHRVVITGTGVISPVGHSTKDFWSAITNGQNGIGRVTLVDPEQTKTDIVAEVKDFDPINYMDRREARRMDRYCQFAVVATQEAIEMSGIDFASMDPFDTSVIIGSGIGGLTTMHNQYEELFLKGGPARVSPFFVPMMISNIAAGKVSMEYNLKGPNFCITTACATGAHAIGEAFRQIKHGYVKAAIAGGAEAPITLISLAGFSNMKALSTATDPHAASLPFDQRRSGFVIAEGGAVMVLESMEHAVARGADIIAEVAGYGATGDAYHITSPDPKGDAASKAMLWAMAEARVNPEQIDYINAHGTGTPLNDKYETNAIKRAFGDHAKKVKISSTKSMTGHLLGAAGSVEAIATALALREGIIPPTINLDRPDPECDLDYTPHKAQKANLKVAVTNSFGFGGQNASLVIKKMEA